MADTVVERVGNLVQDQAEDTAFTSLKTRPIVTRGEEVEAEERWEEEDEVEARMRPPSSLPTRRTQPMGKCHAMPCLSI